MATNTATENSSTEVEIQVQIDPITQQFNSITELIDTLAKTSKALVAEMKTLTKDVNKLRATKTKKVKRVVDPDAPRKLGALERPVPITDELAVFLGLTAGEMYSRQCVTKTINKYVKDNDLQNPENRRYILLESEAGLKLKALLRDPDQPLTFFNIQRYLKVHYPKPEVVEGETSGKSVEGETSGKSVDVADTPVKATESKVVADADVVDESDAPKKKIIRKVVKKTPQAA